MINQYMFVKAPDFVKLTAQNNMDKPSERKESTSHFDEILSSAASKLPAHSANKANSLKHDMNNNDRDYDRICKTYMEKFKEISKAAKDKPESSLNIKDDKVIKEGILDENDDSIKEKAAVDSIAQLFGMRPENVMKLLDNAGINPSELVDKGKINAAVDKLTDFLQLDDSKAQTLSEILKTVENVVSCSFPEVVNSNENEAKLQLSQNGSQEYTEPIIEEKKLVKLNSPNITVIKNDKPADIQKLIEDFKTKLGVLNKMREHSAMSFSEKIADVTNKAVLENSTAVNLDEAEVYNDSQQSNESNQLLNSEKDRDGSAIEGKKNETEAPDDTFKIEFAHESLSKNEQMVDKSNENDSLQLSSTAFNDPDKKLNVLNAVKSQNEIKPPRAEILNQVIDRAKVVLSGDKSEMVMDLKPDHLGKLALKIVTENGIVMARFTAENQQVKEVLEANMQLLKDSLEKQGFSVQGFSVSVGQDSQRKFAESRFAGLSNKVVQSRKILNSLEPTVSASITEVRESLNPYRLSDSQINLTA